MSKKIQAVRGMNDILPSETFLWQRAERLMRQTLASYCFQEIRFPILEKTELFNRSIGEVTDIVEKEMYTFNDRSDESLTLRPEGTASCVRAGVEHHLFYNQQQRLWYLGPFFRYERPQKGRLRQFHQCSAEMFGLEGPDVDAELILLSASILEKLGVKSFCKLQINSIGTPEARKHYRDILVAYFRKHKDKLDEDSVRRLERNPLRILDSKNPEMQQLIAHAPSLLDHLDEASLAHFEQLQTFLTHAGLAFEVNTCLVRGLDYYTKTVFEWVTENLGAQGTVCAGGRYDGLVEELGGKPTPALGFSIGMERTVLLMQQAEKQIVPPKPHAYFITDGDKCFATALKLATKLRQEVKGLRLFLHCGGGSIKKQMEKANKSGAAYAIIIGEHELKTHAVALKSMKEDIPQQSLFHDELAEYLSLKVGKNGN